MLIIIAFPFFGWLARTHGIELFGVYTIILAIFGYASILDLGLSRGVIRVIALKKNQSSYISNLISTVSIFCLFACNQNQVDEPVVQDTFIDNALSVLDELGNYHVSFKSNKKLDVKNQ